MAEDKMNFLVNNHVANPGPETTITICIDTDNLDPETKIDLQYKIMKVLKDYNINLKDDIKFE